MTAAVVQISDHRNRVPQAPAHLKGVARAEWQRVARVLHDRGDCGPEVLAILEAYAVQFGRWRDAEAQIAKAGGAIVKAPKTGSAMHSPYLAVANQANDRMLRLAKALRLTPASGKAVKPREQDDEGAPAGLDI